MFMTAVWQFDIKLFKAITGTTMDKFNNIFRILEAELARTMKVQQEFTQEDQSVFGSLCQSLLPISFFVS